MLNKKIVYEALARTQATDDSNSVSRPKGQDSLISLLIHDVFGGEILKTRSKKNWHFYNRIDGERLDFTRKKTPGKNIEDIPSTPDETYSYVDKVDYLNFFEKFVRVFEETVGLDSYRPGLSA